MSCKEHVTKIARLLAHTNEPNGMVGIADCDRQAASRHVQLVPRIMLFENNSLRQLHSKS